MSSFLEISPLEIRKNPIDLIGKKWMLITAGTPDKFNTMTASWGGWGELWFKPVAFIFVRPQRYTYEFLEKEPFFTLSFFDATLQPKLKFCGTHSGREIDKATECGFLPVATQNGSVYFEEAQLVLECKKLYFQDLDPAHFLDKSISKHYPNNDFHRMYIGEIERALIR